MHKKDDSSGAKNKSDLKNNEKNMNIYNKNGVKNLNNDNTFSSNDNNVDIENNNLNISNTHNNLSNSMASLTAYENAEIESKISSELKKQNYQN